MATTPVFLPRKFHGQRSLVGYSPWGSKESDTTEQPLSLAFLLLPASWQMQCLEAQKSSSDCVDNSHRLRVVPVESRRQLGLWVFDDFLGWLWALGSLCLNSLLSKKNQTLIGLSHGNLVPITHNWMQPWSVLFKSWLNHFPLSWCSLNLSFLIYQAGVDNSRPYLRDLL